MSDLHWHGGWASGKKAEGVDARLMAKRLYADRGQIGRAEAMAAWLKTVDPKGALQAKAAKVEEQQKEPPKEPPPNIEEQPKETAPVLKHPTEATRVPRAGGDEPPPPSAAPRPVVKAVPIATALPHPEPLPFAPGSPVMTGSGIVIEGGLTVFCPRKRKILSSKTVGSITRKEITFSIISIRGRWKKMCEAPFFNVCVAAADGYEVRFSACVHTRVQFFRFRNSLILCPGA